MHRIVYIIFIFLSLQVAAQSAEKGERVKRGLRERMLSSDSTLKKIKAFKDSVEKIQLSNTGVDRIQENINRNMNYMVELQKEQQQKKRTSAIINIAIGTVLFAVLIVGLQRRRKKG